MSMRMEKALYTILIQKLRLWASEPRATNLEELAAELATTSLKESLPCPALPCPSLPCSALPRPALSCPDKLSATCVFC